MYMYIYDRPTSGASEMFGGDVICKVRGQSTEAVGSKWGRSNSSCEQTE